jgi:Putative amidoligase enzyme
MANLHPSIITGFGAEMELNFAFHENLLAHQLELRNLTRDHIVKEIPSAVKQAIGLRHHGRPPLYLNTRPHHRGWVLKIDEEESSLDWKAKGEERANTFGEYRTYWTEPLCIVRSILKNFQNRTIDVEASTKPNTTRSSYKEWKVVNDHSLVPADKMEMIMAMQDRITEQELVNWDNTGVELVTPIMHHMEDDADFDEIRLYLEALQGDGMSDYGIFPSKYGSMHVHIGFADSADTLLVLQHVAFIMLQYEPLLTKLVPFHRNGSHLKNFTSGLCREDTKSNQEQARAYEISRNVSFSSTMDDLGNRVFATDSTTELCKMMQYNPSGMPPGHGTKGHLVNFINIAEADKGIPGAKRTVEFRHHESTVESRAIKMWVGLLLRICDAAERIAMTDKIGPGQKSSMENISSSEKERRKYKLRPSNLTHVHTMEELFDIVGLKDIESLADRDRELRVYWQSRYDQYHDATDGLQPSPDLSHPQNQDPEEEQVGSSIVGDVASGDGPTIHRDHSTSTEYEDDGDVIMRDYRTNS